jgi:hypothetical protein
MPQQNLVAIHQETFKVTYFAYVGVYEYMYVAARAWGCPPEDVLIVKTNGGWARTG